MVARLNVVWDISLSVASCDVLASDSYCRHHELCVVFIQLEMEMILEQTSKEWTDKLLECSK